MAVIMTLELRPIHEVVKSVRGRPVPGSRTVLSRRDKAIRNARRDFRQNRRGREE
jgi:hypothetical protein